MENNKTKILIADDSRVSRVVLEKTLEKSGYEVISVENGLEAWNILKSENAPSLAIIDWMMPEMDGPELIRKIRAANFSNYIFTILLTAKSSKEDIVKGIDAGADDYLAKPFDRAELKARLKAGERLINLEKKLADQNRLLEAVNEKISKVNRRMKTDLEAAAEIQKTLLPNDLPEIPGINLEWLYKPCDELGGDILNIFQLDEKHIALYVLDVSGHGVAASLSSVSLSRILSPIHDQSSILLKKSGNSSKYEIVPPVKVAQKLNSRFCINLESGQYFTLIYAIFNIESRELRFVSAGHPSPILVPYGQTPHAVGTSGLPIGFLEEEEYRECRIILKPGDRILLYSDGIIEQTNENDDQFGTEQLCESLAQKDLSLKNNLKSIIASLDAWSKKNLSDDISMLALEITESDS